MSDSRPNILFIFSDQHRYDCARYSGHPLLQTPALDRLAGEGLRFTQAITPSPICTPCRASLFTGLWPSKHLCIANGDTESPGAPEMTVPSFGAVLRDAGYRTHYVGKWQVHPALGPLESGFETWRRPEEYEGWFRERSGRETRAGFPWWGGVDERLRVEDTMLAWGADRIIEFLSEPAASDRPFLACWCPREPHLPGIVPGELSGLYPSREIAPWDNFPDPLVGKPAMQRQQRMTWRVEDWTWDAWASVVSRYLATVHLMDMQIGRILSALDVLGLADNTMVVYSSDHGDLCGSHGMVDKHYVMYEEVVRVPLLVRWPGRIAPGSAAGDYVIHALDLPPTFCDAAGAAAPPEYQGESLLPLLTRGEPLDRQDGFSMYFGNQFGLFSQRMVRTDRWKYVWNAVARDELYDLKHDPAELNNRSAEPSLRPLKTEFQARLVHWMERTGDRLLNNWTREQLLEGRSI